MKLKNHRTLKLKNFPEKSIYGLTEKAQSLSLNLTKGRDKAAILRREKVVMGRSVLSPCRGRLLKVLSEKKPGQSQQKNAERGILTEGESS